MSVDPERFDRAYYRRYYGVRPVHRPSDIAALAQGVLGMCRWWGSNVRSVLDIGAGPGYWRDALPKGVRYQGIDVSEHACATYGHERRDIGTWSPKRPFDLVVAQGVLQYLDGPTCSRAIEHLSVATRAALYLEVPTARDRTDVLDGDRSDTTAYFRSGTWYRQRLGRHFVAAGAGLWLKPEIVRLYELEGGLRPAARPVRRDPASG